MTGLGLHCDCTGTEIPLDLVTSQLQDYNYNYRTVYMQSTPVKGFVQVSVVLGLFYCQTPDFNSSTLQQKNLDGTIFGVLLFVRCSSQRAITASSSWV